MSAFPGPFTMQAAIAAVHCRAARSEDTDWRQILRLYELLEAVRPSPIVSLNRTVAVAMVNGPADGLNLANVIAAGGELESYHLLHATRADFLRRMGDWAESAKNYRHALALVTNDAERRYREQRLSEVGHSIP